MVARVQRLSVGQLDCLRLVNEHLSSKEIATELDISPHTWISGSAGRFISSASSAAARPRASSRTTAANINV